MTQAHQHSPNKPPHLIFMGEAGKKHDVAQNKDSQDKQATGILMPPLVFWENDSKYAVIIYG